MILQTFVFEIGHLEANIYVMADEKSREAVMIDAGMFDPSVVEFIRGEGLSLSAILITHLHHDHIGGALLYQNNLQCDVYAPAPLPGGPQARVIAPGGTVRAAGFEFQILKTSGHTPEGVSYYCPAHGVCFVGDAIFAGSVGGTADDLHHEEQLGCLRSRILTLPPTTELWSGHGPATTVAIEAAANPFLKAGFTRLP